MASIKKYKPTSPGRRNSSVINYKETLTTTNQPEKSLTITLNKKAGRNNTGSITVRHKGGGNKTRYRIIDFKRNKDGIPAKVATIEYDPNRTAFIALINYADGEKRYILATKDMQVGQEIMSGPTAEIKSGNNLPMDLMPEGTVIHNIELKPGKGGELVRSAGTSAQLLGKDETEKYVIVKFPSGEMRKLLAGNRATVGEVSNPVHNLVRWGKAGRVRYKGVRPTVRGSVMNPNDHPHGGGEGKSPIGRPSPLTPWGKKALGVKTRKHNKQTNKYIIRQRKGRK